MKTQNAEVILSKSDLWFKNWYVTIKMLKEKRGDVGMLHCAIVEDEQEDLIVLRNCLTQYA